MSESKTVLSVVRSEDDEGYPHNLAIVNGTGREIKDAIAASLSGALNSFIGSAMDDELPPDDLYLNLLATIGDILHNALIGVISGSHKLGAIEKSIVLAIRINVCGYIARMLDINPLKKDEDCTGDGYCDEEDEDESEDSDDSCSY